jgi:hypothetical protein
MRSICDTADGSNCVIVNCISVRVSGINSPYPRQREVIYRVIHPTWFGVRVFFFMEHISSIY